MEALNLLKFWKSSSSPPSHRNDDDNSTSITTSASINESETDFDDDSFFELEITALNSFTISKDNHLIVDLKDPSRFKNIKILPIEPISSKPTSPIFISVLKSSPKLRPWSKTKKTEQNRASSKRFPKDSVNKYLNLIKPFYVKVSKQYNDRVKFSDLLYVSSPAASPVPSTALNGSPRKVDGGGFKGLSKHLGKSRSTSAVAGTMSPAVSRRDDSLLQQHDDGIESAILHCKRSFQSSRESSLLSRCSTSDRSRSSPWRKSTEDQLDGC